MVESITTGILRILIFESFRSTIDSIYEYRREDRIVFLYSSVPVIEVVRAVSSIFEINFSTPEDRFNFSSLIKDILFNYSAFTITYHSFVLGYADIFFANCFIPTLKYFPFYKQIMSEFSPKHSHSELSVPDYDIEMNNAYWSNPNSDYGSTSFVECEISGMETYHKLNIPLIHLKTSSEQDDQEEKESDNIIKNKPNTEFTSKPIIEPLDPYTISVKHEVNLSSSNISQ